MYAHKDWESLVMRVPDKGKTMEWIDIRVQRGPALNLPGL